MFLNRQPELALDILMTCASTKGVINTRTIASQTGITKTHAAQVAKLLTREGWLKTHRGLHGGMELALPASGIRLGDVLFRTHPSFVRGAKPGSKGGRPSVLDGAFGEMLGSAVSRFVETLNAYTIEDIKPEPDAGSEPAVGDQ